MAKSLFIFLFFFFSLGLTTHKKCGKVSHHKCHSHMNGKSHDEFEKVVHRPCSSCISSVINIEWNYSSYQPWSNNEWLVEEMMAI